MASLNKNFRWETILGEVEQEEVIDDCLYIHPNIIPKEATHSMVIVPLPRPQVSNVYNPLATLQVPNSSYETTSYRHCKIGSRGIHSSNTTHCRLVKYGPYLHCQAYDIIN